jgi:3-oxoacyl-(acyl-carrier-protein) synthase/NAD(P)-dependent dehydrogenase (short-subunit alcohol dehydrogenase family)
MAPDIETLRDVLRKGIDCVQPLSSARRKLMGIAFDAKFPEVASLDGIDLFDRELFGIGREEASLMDPEQRLLLEHSFLALEDAGIPTEDLAGFNVGVFVAATTPSGFAERAPLDKAYSLTGTMAAMSAGRISYWLNSTGPAQLVNTACSSSLVAVIDAMQALRNGTIDLAIVGAFRVHCGHFDDAIFDPLGIHAVDLRCRSFDASAGGVGIGEGGAVIVLKRLSDANSDSDDVKAVLLGGAKNHDGRSANGITAPNIKAQTNMYELAWRDAGIGGSDVGYFEAHGTGTLLGDPIEYRGLLQALKNCQSADRPAQIGSIKSNMGHLDCAAGMAAFVKCVLSLRFGEIYPTVHFKAPNPHLGYEDDVVSIANDFEPWQQNRRRLCGVSAFGLSGTNAHLVLGEANPEIRSVDAAAVYRVVHVSGRSPSHLAECGERFVHALEHCDSQRWGDVVWSQNIGRTVWPYGITAGGKNPTELARDLRRRYQSASMSPRPRLEGVVLLLGPEVAATSIARKWLSDTNVLAIEMPASGAGRFITEQYIAANLWRSMGVEFAGIIASGVGIFAKRALLGELTLKEAIAKAECSTELADQPNEERLREAVRAFSQRGSYLYLESHTQGKMAQHVANVAPDVLIDHMIGDTGWEAFHRHWQAGLPVTWKLAAQRGRRVGLAKSPLIREICWPTTHATRRSVETPAATIFSVPIWAPLQEFNSVSEHGENVLLIRPFSGKYVLDATALRHRVSSLVVVEQNQTFIRLDAQSFRLDLSAIEQIERLFDELSQAAPAVIVIDDLLHLPCDESSNDRYWIARIFVAVVQAVWRMKLSTVPCIVVASNGGSGPDLPATHPLKSVVRGFEKVAAEEFPKLRSIHLDLPSEITSDDMIGCVLSALGLKVADSHLWLVQRNGRVFVQNLIEIKPPPDSAQSFIRRRGVYFITGGAGGIGLELARSLIETYDARVALVSRDGVRAAMRAGTLLGPALKIVAADVTSYEQVQRAQREVEAEWGPVNGVIHSAGVAGSGLLRTRSFDEIISVLEPKVTGAINLMRAFDGAAVDFILLMSSLSTRLPAVGQADYCAANIFLDEFASACRRSSSVNVVSAAWTRWRDTGMAANTPLSGGLGAPIGISVADGVAACWKTLSISLPNVAISESSVSKLVEVANSRNSVSGANDEVITDRAQLNSSILAKVSDILNKSVNVTDDLFDLGATSLDLIAIFEFVDKLYPNKLSVQVLLDAPTVATVVDVICGSAAVEAQPAHRESIILDLE